VNRSIKAVGADFIGAVKCSGIASANFSRAFEVKKDANIENALSEYRKEKTRIEHEITNIKKSIAAAQATVNAMNAKIKACNSSDYTAQIRSANNNIDYYKREMNKATDTRAKEEASVQYRAAQKQKEQAEASQRTNNYNKADYEGQKNMADKTVNECNAQKKNLEKRLAQVKEIIRLF
jgi:predicted  nucleic acid-binding Zn-ribbon protein